MLRTPIRLIEYLGSRSAWTLMQTALAFVVAIGFADYLTGHELSLFLFYLVPVAIVTLYGGIWPGLFVSLASASAWLLADLLTVKTYSHPIIPYWNAAVRMTILFIVVILQNALAKEKYIARTDYLTGLANRKHFFETAKREIERARRYGQPFSTAYIDIDNFKDVNDRYGHAAGDKLLQSVGNIILRNIRAVDFAARLGGDEFALLLPQADAMSTRAVLTKLQLLLHETMKKKLWLVTFSTGVVTFVKPPETVDEMVRMADGLMYGVKAAGKNMIKFDIYNGQANGGT
ncbi:MAG: diguanylate cyclase [Nitrospirota bacterium]